MIKITFGGFKFPFYHTHILYEYHLLLIPMIE